MTTPLHATLDYTANLRHPYATWTTARKIELELIAEVQKRIAGLAQLRLDTEAMIGDMFTPAEIAAAKAKSCSWPESHIEGQRCVGCAWGLAPRPKSP